MRQLVLLEQVPSEREPPSAPEPLGHDLASSAVDGQGLLTADMEDAGQGKFLEAEIHKSSCEFVSFWGNAGLDHGTGAGLGHETVIGVTGHGLVPVTGTVVATVRGPSPKIGGKDQSLETASATEAAKTRKRLRMKRMRMVTPLPGMGAL